MKMKLLGVFICVMLMATFFTVGKPAEKNNNSKTSHETILSTFDADVPVWDLGDQWTYKIDNITIALHQENQTVDLTLTIAELPFEVINVTDTIYTLTFETFVSGQCDLDVNLGDGPVNMTITFTNVAISGTVNMEKTTLGVQELSVLFNGRFKIKIHEQPYIQLPFTLPVIPVPVTMNITTICEPAASLLQFPLTTGTVWNTTAINLTVNGKIKSIWLNILHFINAIAGIFNEEFLPPEIETLLPVVDIKDALTAFGSTNVLTLPVIESAFFCLNTENVTVPAGTYESYNITVIGGLGQCFYAPEAGNFVKIQGNFEQIIPYVTNINMELLETNHR